MLGFSETLLLVSIFVLSNTRLPSLLVFLNSQNQNRFFFFLNFRVYFLTTFLRFFFSCLEPFLFFFVHFGIDIHIYIHIHILKVVVFRYWLSLSSAFRAYDSSRLSSIIDWRLADEVGFEPTNVGFKDRCVRPSSPLGIISSRWDSNSQNLLTTNQSRCRCATRACAGLSLSPWKKERSSVFPDVTVLFSVANR